MKERTLLAFLFLAIAQTAGITSPGITSVKAEGMRSARGHACVFDQMTLRTEPNTCRPRARAYPAYVNSTVTRAIYDSALVFGVPYSTLLSIARCESALNPKASNGTHFGLFQFLPETFRRAVNQLRSYTGVTAKTYWNPLDASYAAGFLFVTGHATSWTCVSAISTHAR